MSRRLGTSIGRLHGTHALAGLAVSIALAACGSAVGPAQGGSTTLTVFAAASLLDVVGAATRAYGPAAGVELQTSADGSTALRTQIEQGAQADVFLSADTRNPEVLAADRLVDGAVVPFAHNRLVIIVPRDNPANIRTAADLGRSGVKIVAAGDGVPISGYAASLVEALASTPGIGAGFAARYTANVVSREDNVKAVVAKIELGEGDAAIVYASDAKASSAVLVIPLPRGIEVVATYAGVVPASARNRAAGHAFLGWLAGSSGQEILSRFGFSPIS